MLYTLVETQRHLWQPWRQGALAAVSGMSFFPQTFPVSWVRAGLETMYYDTGLFPKPAFGLSSTVMEGQRVEVVEETVLETPWCSLKHFSKAHVSPGPKVLMVAPMSGHHATLLRQTVEAFLPDHDVFITDWKNPKDVPLGAGDFGLETYMEDLIQYLHHLGPRVHVLAVCQPAVPVLAVCSVLALSPLAPASMILVGGPIDTRQAPTEVNRFAQQHTKEWFERHVLHTVPAGFAGAGRLVYPGFLQLMGFMSMNLDRHLKSHQEMFQFRLQQKTEDLRLKTDFYDDYLSVMDLPATYYLETIERVFQHHHLPKGCFMFQGEPVRPQDIRHTALMTVEGMRDDISGIGQTEAAHTLCSQLPMEKKLHMIHPTAGHYGLFSGSRFRQEIAPAMKRFIQAQG